MIQGLLKVCILVLIVAGIFYFKSPHEDSLHDEKKFMQIAEIFGAALFDGRFQDAYELTSNTLRERKTLEAFRNDHINAQDEFGKALKIETGVGSIGSSVLAGDDWPFPREIPPADRKAWMHVTFATEVDEESGEMTRCYDCWFLIVNEKGEDKIAHYQYAWCD